VILIAGARNDETHPHREERSDVAVWIRKVTARPFAAEPDDFKL